MPLTTMMATATQSLVSWRKTLGFRSFLKTSNYSKLTFEYHNISEFRRGGNLLDLPPHETDITEQTDHQINGEA